MKAGRPFRLESCLLTVGRFAALLLICFLFVFPLLFMLSASFKSSFQVFARPPVWIFRPTLDNYREVFITKSFVLFFMNSLVVGAVATLVTLFVSVPAAYALARLKFAGQENLAFWILSIRMMPPIVVLVPMFYIFRSLGLLGTRASIIIAYQTINIPLAVWMLRGFFLEVPEDIENAALVDGCGRASCLLRVVLPISRPALAAVGLLCFVFCWNEFLFASVFTSVETRTLPVAVTQFIRLRGVMWGPMTAAAVSIVAPILAISVAMQRDIIRGLSLGGVK